MDHRTILGLYVKLQSVETFRRLLAYLGATPAQLAEFENCHRRREQGTIKITLAPGRKKLIGDLLRPDGRTATAGAGPDDAFGGCGDAGR